ncbi:MULTISPECIES: alpha/beta hydrolase [Nocardiaceae]|uniref:Alpha/beta hydrolase family esterase n=1 Tax=Rhodococcoides corynebacterioides TaxID=53972 RepID=A0ABS2KYE9_9NOCA|nr:MULTISPECIES: alpha/beta hydrolase [Rhodococcus]MBM7416326.1 putative alpha/beta hydrolase family esterase [Rhodococcus corynebacterioides]MBP1114579.1 putative alpha/beta hydrolase family esterase [Rhodococcus sp. PvP016]
MTRLLFVHGAGGEDDDEPLAEEFGALLGATLDMPRIPSDDMSVEAWAGQIRRSLGASPDLVIAHSFGATVLLHVLASVPFPAATLLAMPDWSASGWDVPQYEWPTVPPGVSLTLHHCRDDDVVPFSHLALASAQLPDAGVVEHPRGGHQFDGAVVEVVASMRL